MSVRTLFAAAVMGALAFGPPAHAQPGVIDVDPLAKLDPWAVGALRPGEQALPKLLWRGADPASLMAALEQTGQSPPAPAAAALMRRTLLSSGAAPQGVTIDAARRRFAALTRLGAADAIPTMVQTSEIARADPTMAIYAIQAQFGRSRTGEACAIAQTVEGDPPPRFVLRVRAFCFAQAGQAASADLAMEVAAAHDAGDAWLADALAAIGGSTGGPAANFETSFNAAVSLAAKLKPGPAPLGKSSIMALRTVAVSEAAPAALRAEAAFAAFKAGALTADEARQILAQSAPAKPKPAPPARGRRAGPPSPATPAFAPAAILRDAKAAGAGEAEAAILAKGLSGAPSYADFAALARLARPRLSALPRSAQTAPHAATLARAALAVGDADLAFDWRGMIGLGGAAMPSAADQARLDLAIAALTASAASGRVALDTAIAAAQQSPPAQRAALLSRVGRDAAILAALGVTPTTAQAAFLRTAPPMRAPQMPANRAAALRAAAARSAAGETALLAALAVAPGAERLDPAGLTLVIRALDAVGLASDARAVAVEALIG